nr:hypothetical protein [Gammaproteobacteria bacterium]
ITESNKANAKAIEVLSDRITDSNKANAKAIESVENSIKPLATKESVDALSVRITDSNKAYTQANNDLMKLLFLLITLYAAEKGIQIYDARSSSLSPTPIESADPSTPKQPVPSSATDAGASSATVSDQTLETNSKTAAQPE